MKTKTFLSSCNLALGLFAGGQIADAQTAAFTYQGKLEDGGRPTTASAPYSFRENSFEYPVTFSPLPA